jgi:hypothetical protein
MLEDSGVLFYLPLNMAAPSLAPTDFHMGLLKNLEFRFQGIISEKLCQIFWKNSSKIFR